MRGGANGEVETEGVHGGLLGKISPLKGAPRFALTGEAGFSRYANEARRNVGLGRIRADFKQRVYSVGVGAEYGIEAGSARLTPFARLRHARFRQERMEERGGLTRTRIDGFSGKSLSSELGVRFSKAFTAPRGAVTPYALVSWRHEYGDMGLPTRARYMSLDGGYLDSFELESVRRDRDTTHVGAGIRASRGLEKGRHLGINADYKASLDRNGVSHAFSVLLEFAF
jgi:outer membrane autotransporter protein